VSVVGSAFDFHAKRKVARGADDTHFRPKQQPAPRQAQCRCTRKEGRRRALQRDARSRKARARWRIAAVRSRRSLHEDLVGGERVSLQELRHASSDGLGTLDLQEMAHAVDRELLDLWD
jgi:hypothetical protein